MVEGQVQDAVVAICRQVGARAARGHRAPVGQVAPDEGELLSAVRIADRNVDVEQHVTRLDVVAQRDVVGETVAGELHVAGQTQFQRLALVEGPSALSTNRIVGRIRRAISAARAACAAAFLATAT